MKNFQLFLCALVAFLLSSQVTLSQKKEPTEKPHHKKAVTHKKTQPKKKVVTKKPSTGKKSVEAPAGFVSVWKVDGADKSIHLPLVSGGSYKFSVNWGDDTKNEISTWDDPQTTHNYAKEGEYTVVITGTIVGWSFDNKLTSDVESYENPNAAKLQEIKSWGTLALGDTRGQFAGAKNLKITTTKAPNLRQTKNLSYAFYYATNFNSNINSWDVSNVVDMTSIFHNASNFDQPLDDWNVSNVTSLKNMFFRAKSFNQPIDTWNVSLVIDMRNTFNLADRFDQPLDSWGVKVSRVTHMRGMFKNAKSFSQDISGWKVGKVLDCQGFSGNSRLNKNQKPRFTNCSE